MKHLFLFLLLLTLASTIDAQETVSGKVIESNQSSVPGATILLLHAKDSLLAKGQLSGPAGTYKIEGIEPGNYFLQISAIGFETWVSAPMQFEEGTPAKEVGQIVLASKTAQLKEVQVVAKTPLFTQKVDRLQINVASSSVNAGSNALAVLQRSPGVIVNRQSNSISMSGKFGVIILINGKVSRMPQDAIKQMLESMGADNIERIELIHTPPANFDADGLAGIINVVLKQSPDEGLNGSYSLSGGYGKREKAGAGMNFNYRKNIVNLYGSYDYKFNHNPQVFTNGRSFTRDGKLVKTDGSSTRKPDLHLQNARVGADFQLSKKTVIGVVGGFFDRYWDMHANNIIDITSDGNLDSRVDMYTREINGWRSFSSNANITHEFTADQKLSFDIDYVNYTINNPSDYQITTTDNVQGTAKKDELRVRKRTPIRLGVAKLDYNRTLKKNVQFEIGAKATRSLFDNDVQVENLVAQNWQIDPTLTSLFGLKEDVLAGYTTFSFKLNTKTDVKAGVRYEHTDTYLGEEGKQPAVDRSYGNFFPSFYVSRIINESQSLNLSYSRRIWRPGFTQLAPYLIFYDPNTVTTGNPALQPGYVHAFRMDYRIKSVSITAEHNFESPSIRDLPFVNESTNQQTTYPENNGNTRTSFFVLGLPWQPKKWWQTQNNFYAVHQLHKTIYAGTSFLNPNYFAGFNSNHTITLPHAWSLEVNGDFTSKTRQGITTFRPYGTLNFSVQKRFGDKWGNLTFNVTDALQSANWYGTTKAESLDLFVKTGYIQAERTFMLTWTNKFGNKRLKDARNRATGASEEMRRL
jgi:hypothetical protein